MRPLADFGFGRRSIEEGLLGVFAVAGVGMTALVMTWVSAATTAARRHTYQMKMSFPRAMGITVGTPVRIRGVQVGSVLSVRPSLASVDVLCEIDDEAIKVPRNALVEANQSGLIAETLIDITPRMPLPPDDTLGPKDTRCHDQGHLVCHMGEIEGEVGTSLDGLVGVCTRLARRMEAGTMDTMEDTAKAAQDAATHAIPLLEKMKLIATNVAPMVEDLKDGEAGPTASRLLTELHDLAESMIRITEVMADEPQLETMKTMVTRSERCLAEVERISKDLSKVTGDDALMTNLKSIVQSVSRILES